VNLAKAIPDASAGGYPTGKVAAGRNLGTMALAAINHGKTRRTRTFTRAQSASRAGPSAQSKIEAAAAAAGAGRCSKKAGLRAAITQTGLMNDANLRALEEKIARVLAGKPQCFLTHPAELKVLTQMAPDQLREFAMQHGWRVVRRIGGRQIEFYNDVGARYHAV
jgi:hypothetical protein